MHSAPSLTGIGLRAPHHHALLEERPQIAWLEVHSENFFADGGKSLHQLEKIRQDYPISLHGVSLSLGSADELNWMHLEKLRHLSSYIDPCLISEHLAWSSINDEYLHDLFPLPYTEEALMHIVSRIQQIQDYLKKQILIENISSYVRFDHSTIPEWEFLQEAAHQSGCGILLDINNIYINSVNHPFNPLSYLTAISTDLVQEIHLAGFATLSIDDQEMLVDSHHCPIAPAVWALYQQAIRQLGAKPTIIEWDNDLPSLETLCSEAYRADQLIRETYVTQKNTD